MGERIIDLSMDIKSGMVANRDFAGNIFVPLISHEQSKAFHAGVPGDPFLSSWNYIGMTEHTGTHVVVDGHIVLLATGHHKRYFPKDEVLTMNPEVSAEAVRWLYEHHSRMHGVEGPSTDILEKQTFPSHRACRDLKIAHYEWLVNLEELIGKGEFMFYGIPLRLKGGSGSPVRAFAVVKE